MFTQPVHDPMGVLVGNCMWTRALIRAFVALVLSVSSVHPFPGGGDWFCTVLGQALGLLVPVGWALLLYTSGLSTPCSVGGLTQLTWWETSS